MRMMMKCILDTEMSNQAIKDGSLPALIQRTHDELKPEAAYFFAENGQRTGFFIFDMKDTSDIPSLAEPWFLQLKAKIEFQPVMNLDDVKAGVQKAMNQMAATV